MTRLSWTQPICDTCWWNRNPERVPIRIADGKTHRERCAFCGEQTMSGIYVRHDPATVPYPATRED